jgi:hypothetical protein
MGMHQDGRMRVPRLRPAVVAGAVGVLTGALIGAGPAAAAATLVLRPDHGRPTTPFAVEYQFTAQGADCPLTVSFSWDGRPLGTAHVTRPGQRPTSLCVAALGATPPADDRDPGRHQVAVAAVAGHPAQVKTYTIQPGATPTPTRSPTPGRTTADPTRQPDQTDDPVGSGVNTSAAAVAPIDTGGGAVLGAASPSTGGGGLTAFVLILGGLLTLGGLGIFGVLVYWTRRGTGGGVEPETEVYGE